MKSLLAVVISILAIAVHAGEPPKDAPKVAPQVKSWWTDVSATPYASVLHEDLAGKALLGVGLDLGYNINNTVSLHVANLSQEVRQCGIDQWDGDPLIKKTSVMVRADLVRYSQERLVTYVLARGDRDWSLEDWGFGVGVGEELRFTKNFSAIVDYSLVAQFDNPKFGQLRAGISLRF